MDAERLAVLHREKMEAEKEYYERARGSAKRKLAKHISELEKLIAWEVGIDPNPKKLKAVGLSELPPFLRRSPP